MHPFEPTGLRPGSRRGCATPESRSIPSCSSPSRSRHRPPPEVGGDEGWHLRLLDRDGGRIRGRLRPARHHPPRSRRRPGSPCLPAGSPHLHPRPGEGPRRQPRRDDAGTPGGPARGPGPEAGGFEDRLHLLMAQLPDTLHLLAWSLQAGHALPQAVDTVAKEAWPPDPAGDRLSLGRPAGPRPRAARPRPRPRLFARPARLPGLADPTWAAGALVDEALETFRPEVAAAAPGVAAPLIVRSPPHPAFFT